MEINDDNNIPRGVYFIYAPNQNKIKIGRSKDIETRFIQLRTGFMDEGVLLFGILTSEEIKLESKLHSKFSHLRDSGEWFFLTKELRHFIDNRANLYSKIKNYQNIEKIENTLTYKSLGMFKFITYLKNIQNKYVLPLILILAGSIFAYNNYSIESELNRSEMLKYSSYLILILYPLYTPILARHIIAYCSVKTGIFFFLLLATGLIVEVFNIIVPVQAEIINVIRILLLSAYLPFTKNVLAVIVFRMREEKILKKATENYRQELNYVKLFELRISIGKKLVKSKKVMYYFVHWCAILTVLGLNVYLLLQSDYYINNRVIIITILDLGILFWFYLNYINKTDFLNRIKKYVISVTIFIVLMISQYLEPNSDIFWEIIFIMSSVFLPISAFGLFSVLQQKKYEIHIKELDEILDPILTKVNEEST